MSVVYNWGVSGPQCSGTTRPNFSIPLDQNMLNYLVSIIYNGNIVQNLCEFCQFFLYDFLGPKCTAAFQLHATVFHGILVWIICVRWNAEFYFYGKTSALLVLSSICVWYPFVRPPWPECFYYVVAACRTYLTWIWWWILLFPLKILLHDPLGHCDRTSETRCSSKDKLASQDMSCWQDLL